MARLALPVCVWVAVLVVAHVGGGVAIAETDVASTATVVPGDGTDRAIVGEYGEATEQFSDGAHTSASGVDDGVPVGGFVLLASYSRFDDSDPLNHENRARLYGTVQRLP